MSSSRFLDLIESSQVEKVFVVYNNYEEYLISNFMNVASFFGIDKTIDRKVTLIPLNYTFVDKVLRKLSRASQSVLITKSLLRNSHIAYAINEYIKKADFIWTGDNDFDGSNLLTILLRDLVKDSVPIVRSYKETRYVKKWDERYALETVDKLIFPDAGYISFFNSLYNNIRLKSFTYADIDWRYSKLIEYVKSISTPKLSKTDGIPHVCIFAGRAIWDPSEKRSASRYYYIPIIKELIKRGIAVHLHALRIIKSLDDPIVTDSNPYNELAKESKLFVIESAKSINDNIEMYKVLKLYDAGILHNIATNDPLDFKYYQKINIPNRLYEYQMADVVPITMKGSLPVVEKIIEDTGFGIIYENYDELSNKLWDLVGGHIQNTIDISKIHSFKDFSDVLLAFK